MTDHVARMVHGWFDRAQERTPQEGAQSSGVSQLVDAIHRMIREAEDEVRGRCEEIAQQIAGPELGGQIALAIRMSTPAESLPRRTLPDGFVERSDN